MKGLHLALVFFTIISGCSKKQSIRPVMPDVIKGDTTMTNSRSYLALGDSYTIGEAVPLTQSFPYQLIDLLASSKIPTAHPTIIATTGWTTDNLINAIAHSGVTDKKYDIVTLLIGVNDQFQGLSQGNYRTKFVQVLHTAIDFANGDTSRVFVLSIPDYGVTPFAGGRDGVIGPLIDQFNTINKAESQKAGVNYLDITDISRNAANDGSLIAADGLHPSAKMYAQWVQRLESLVAARLKK
jgi:lysophospholipase L1-like esterase